MAHSTEVTIGSKSVDIGKLQNGCILVGAILTALSALGTFGILGPSAIGTSSYLFALIFWTGISFGMLGLTMLHHAVRGSWSVSILRLLEAGSSVPTLIVLFLLFIPLVIQNFSGTSIYDWANPSMVASSALL